MKRATISEQNKGHRSPTAIYRAALVVFLAISTYFGASLSAADAQSYTFSNVTVEGGGRIEPGTVLSYAGIEPGQTVTAGQLNEAYQNVLGSGLFESVAFEPRGGTLVIVVQEFPTINRINIEGNSKLKDEALLGLLRSQPRRVYSPTVAEQDAAAIVDAYEQAGRLAATVEPVIIRRSNNRVDLVFEVAEGKVVEVERISFVGNRDFSDRRLRRVLESKQAGLFRQLIQRDTFIGDRVQFDRQVLTDFYRSRGYVDFDVLSVASEFSRERNAFFVTFTVREGLKYRYGNISVSSDLPEIDVSAYQNAVAIRSGQVYNPLDIDNTIARLERLAVQQDLDFIRVDPRVTRDDRNQLLFIDFAIVRGPRIFVERIDIEGNATTLDRVIRRQFTAVEGDPFNPREIREAASRIEALGFFSKAEVNPREGSSPDQVIVDVDVEEQPTGSLGFGASYSGSAGFGLTFNFSERNFLGRGQALSFDVSTGSGTQNYSFGFREPAFLGRDVAYSFNIAYTTTEEANSTDYNTTLGRVTTGFDFPLGEYSRLGLNVFGRLTDITDVPAESSAILAAEAARGQEWAIGAGYEYTYRTLRRGLNPDAGILFRWSQDFAGIGGDVSYVKSEALLVGETKVVNDEVTLRAIFEGGALNSVSGGDSRIVDRFTLNGKIRGFEYFGVGPRDLGAANEDALGGNYFAVAKFEAEFPLGLPEEYGIHGGVFLDVGSVWGLDNTAGTSTVDDDFALRSAAGISIFWDTPIGPLRFNFSKALVKEDYDEEREFDLTISTRF
ncbi:outer membrane protein assembly factor BamA [Pseudoruegeria sp. HB172150]|uniref:outer membrane protein assembly factor BamA n=1 Tax=Pseudoruegeria sp. HB172150 TaxID=2721164 RepID=UPI00155681CC|nr:outer membrane protein assembly factor BamA [Pseudoruegeria sp. HB172150]